MGVWAKLDVGFHDDPRLLALPRSQRLVWVEGLTWCAHQQTDGAIPAFALSRITDDPAPTDAAAALVAAGLWASTEGGWQIVDYTRTQMTKAGIDRAKIEAAWRAERTTMHRRGEHDLCIKGTNACRSGQLEWVEWRRLLDECASANATPAHLRSLDETRRDQTLGRIESKSKVGASAPPAADAPAALPRPRRVRR